MSRALKYGLVSILLFNAASGLFGGWMLVSDPTGAKLQMPVTWLEHSPFNTYLIPGITLFLVNGIFSLWVTWMLIWEKRRAPFYLIVQGTMSLIWILVQIISIEMLSWLQLLYGAIGLVLLVVGWRLWQLRFRIV